MIKFNITTLLSNGARHPRFWVGAVIARFSCFFIGHKVNGKRVCSRCQSEFGVPKMKNPPSPPNKKDLVDLADLSIVGISLRDFFAAEAMKAEVISWNAEMTDTHRAALLEDMIERHGQTTVYTALAKNSFEMADIMLQEREQ